VRRKGERLGPEAKGKRFVGIMKANSAPDGHQSWTEETERDVIGDFAKATRSCCAILLAKLPRFRVAYW